MMKSCLSNYLTVLDKTNVTHIAVAYHVFGLLLHHLRE